MYEPIPLIVEITGCIFYFNQFIPINDKTQSMKHSCFNEADLPLKIYFPWNRSFNLNVIDGECDAINHQISEVLKICLTVYNFSLELDMSLEPRHLAYEIVVWRRQKLSKSRHCCFIDGRVKTKKRTHRLHSDAHYICRCSQKCIKGGRGARGANLKRNLWIRTKKSMKAKAICKINYRCHEKKNVLNSSKTPTLLFFRLSPRTTSLSPLAPAHILWSVNISIRRFAILKHCKVQVQEQSTSGPRQPQTVAEASL